MCFQSHAFIWVLKFSIKNAFFLHFCVFVENVLLWVFLNCSIKNCLFFLTLGLSLDGWDPDFYVSNRWKQIPPSLLFLFHACNCTPQFIDGWILFSLTADLERTLFTVCLISIFWKLILVPTRIDAVWNCFRK